MSAETLLARLDGVKQTAPGRWVARCPAHEDRSPSLSIRELPDGRVLLHDFAGCDTESVLAAVGLRMTDLFPERLPDQRYRPIRSRIPAADLLLLIADETEIVALAAAHLIEHKTLSETDWQRLVQAHQRISAAAMEVRK
ncbi:MAG: DNA primase [Gammaproteobacteria bacterium]|nr:DNA primase [Gammaproteobacteria bacterium]